MIQAFGDILKNTILQHQWLFWLPSKYFNDPAHIWISVVYHFVYFQFEWLFTKVDRSLLHFFVKTRTHRWFDGKMSWTSWTFCRNWWTTVVWKLRKFVLASTVGVMEMPKINWTVSGFVDKVCLLKTVKIQMWAG